jgi:hypothetical protein
MANNNRVNLYGAIMIIWKLSFGSSSSSMVEGAK